MSRDEVMALALEAGFKRDIHGIYKGDWMNPDADCLPELERFAQLIVRECLIQGKLSQSQTVVNGSEEYNVGRAMGIEVFMNQIKKHFGVEE